MAEGADAMAAEDADEIVVLGPEYSGWDAILSLILKAFASMDGVIDPPSSALRLTAEGLREKAAKETVFALFDGPRPLACLFCDPRGDTLYLGKLAVDPACQGMGLGRRLVEHAEEFALEEGLSWLELQVRVELTANHAFFSALAFKMAGEGAHDGYDRPTWFLMRKRLDQAKTISD